MSREPHQDQKIEGSLIERSQVQLGQAEGDLTQVQGSNNWVLKFGINLFGNQQSSSRQEYRNRQALIDKVKRSWIEGVLDRSLFDRVQIELGLERCFDALALDYETPEQLRQPLPKGIKVSEQFFQQLGVGRTLLILGDPGAGKTTILLELARDLLVQAECDVNLPISVVFNLSSWINPKQSIADWLVQELNTKYQVSKALSRNWIKEQQLFLLLDGLDEVRVEQQEDCVKAINQFAQRYGQTEIVVCSRIADYKAISQRFRFQAAIFVQPLSDEQVKDYLDQAGENLIGIKTALRTDVVLQELAHTPLMLSVMTLAYEGFSAEELPKISLEERRKHLFDKYIERMFQRRRITQRYSKEKVIHWLTWLAQRMIQASQTVFLIEQMQPTWLHSKDEQKDYILRNMLAGGLIGVLVILLIFVPMGYAQQSASWEFNDIGQPINEQLPKILFSAGFLGLLIGGGTAFEIKPVERLVWSWKTARQRARKHLIEFPKSLIWMIPIMLVTRLIHGTPITDILRFFFLLPVIIPCAYFIFLIAILLFGGLSISTREMRVIPNQGIWNSVQNFIIIGSVTGLVGLLPGLFLTLGNLSNAPLIGLGIGLLGSLKYGGATCIKHFILRLTLYRKGSIPWNYAQFLDYATERLFLKKVGGGYIFIHRLLMENFAQIEKTSAPLTFWYRWYFAIQTSQLIRSETVDLWFISLAYKCVTKL